jgi:hypothetical protein
MIFFDKAGIDQFIDPEMDNALGSDPEKINHFLVGRHAPVLAEEVAELSGYALSGSFLFHGPQRIEHMFYCQEIFFRREQTKKMQSVVQINSDRQGPG